MRPIQLLAFVCATSTLLLLGACGSTTSAPAPASAVPDAAAPDPVTPLDAAPPVDNGAPSTTYPAPHPAMPQLVNQAKGAILATPKVHLIVFPGYDHTTEMVTFATGVGATSYWSAANSEYGVSALGYDGITELTGETAPATIKDTEVQSYLAAKLAAGTFGTPDRNVIYSIVYPKTTTISSGTGGLGGGTSCSSFGGYHSDTPVTVAGVTKNYAFAVLPTCASFGGQTELDGLTGAASHEWAEAATDPYPSTNRGADSAYSSVDADHIIWMVTGGGGENGDLCVSEGNAFFKPADFPFTVQRTWSNKLAAASHDPCAPNLPGPYFNSAPVLGDAITLDLSLLGGGSVDTKGVKVGVGKSVSIEVDLFSDAATSGPWTVAATDVVAAFTKGAPTLGFAWDRTSGVNGEKLHLTVTVLAAGSVVGTAHPFVITSTLGTKKVQWPGIVSEP